MAFENVFDSSLIDYSADQEKKDKKYVKDNCLDVIEKINTSNGVPGSIKIKGYPTKWREITLKYDSELGSDDDEYYGVLNREESSNLMIYDKKNGILYSAIVVTAMYNIEYLDDDLEDLGMLVLEVPALHKKRFVFFGWGQNWGNGRGLNSLYPFSYSHNLSSNTMEKAHKKLIKEFKVSNIGDGQYKLCLVRLDFI